MESSKIVCIGAPLSVCQQSENALILCSYSTGWLGLESQVEIFLVSRAGERQRRGRVHCALPSQPAQPPSHWEAGVLHSTQRFRELM